MRRGFTLVEIVLMAAIASVMAGAIWYVFISTSRQSQKLDVRMRAMQASHLLLEMIQTDLKSFYYDEALYRDLAMVDRALPSRESWRLTFYVFKDYATPTTDTTGGVVATESVQYQFDPATHTVSRNGEPFKLARFESVTFKLEESEPGTNPANVLEIKVVYVAEDALDDPTRLAQANRVSYSARITLGQRSLAEATSYWLQNPYDIPSR